MWFPFLAPMSRQFVPFITQKIEILSPRGLLPALHNLLIQQLILPLCIFLFFIVFSTLLRLNIKKTGYTRTQEHFQALLSITTPTQSMWPTACSALRSYTYTSRRIEFSLTGLMDDIFSGRLELRDPYNDLPELFCDEVRAYGWSIRIRVGNSWWIKVLSWFSWLPISHGQFKPLTIYALSSSSLCGQSEITGDATFSQVENPQFAMNKNQFYTNKQNSVNYAFHPATPILVSKDPSVICLDFVSRSGLKPFIRLLQSSLRPGSLATLEFTTRASTVRFMDRSFILSALPLLPRKYLSSENLLPQRTPTLLLNSFHHIIKLLGASPNSVSPCISIESVLNTSAEYSKLLQETARELEDSRYTRDAFVCRWGIEAWREHKFWVAWEAGLFRAGFLQRWVIVVRK